MMAVEKTLEKEAKWLEETIDMLEKDGKQCQ